MGAETSPMGNNYSWAESEFKGEIDAVYTWVNGTDPAWAERRDEAAATLSGTPIHPTASARGRFEDHEELRYSLRSIEMYAPWIRHIYVVTDRQVPAWLASEHDKVTIVDHTELLPPEVLPTFNSHSIETALHLIPGLSEHFLYFNDDVFLGSKASPDDFFTPDGKNRVFLSEKGIEGDLPVLQAARKNAKILYELTGTVISRRYRHTPHPQRVSVSRELEAAIPDEVELTRSHRFRDPDDISFASSMALSYSVATGRGVESDIDYGYLDLGSSRAFLSLLKLMWRGPKHVVCLNQIGDISTPVKHLLTRVMKKRWPIPSTFERVGQLSMGRDSKK